MIVVDTNVIAYLIIDTPHTDDARRVVAKEGRWSAPLLWRSELRNVLIGYIRRGSVTYEEAMEGIRVAERLLADTSMEVDHADVLQLALMSGCTTYDCEFVAVARAAGVPLVTADRKLLAAFPFLAVAPEVFAPAFEN
ncbi:PIN domain-containing protein [Longimicrobium terrae]|uniref:Ribonuclease VapC n=1 Tax=Longimicrobium terrae TaxID=1639882 RepID=A0A841H5D9_9BACT|nr:putative nucleic acid-binding protein [Longimicrobium terrae]MBB6073445.1 putative nucleic acid-binding protein [Longimicrobium terrae]NNC32567.1 type II toxin-antitoxin system VapC family toxin [Longimicrobium terrae]